MMNHQEQMTHYLNAWINGMIDCGVNRVVISPGSRSTPLALLFAARAEMEVYLDIDERSAGFLALGLAKESRRPVALLCTSGTAAANYYPAIVEAKLARVPLLVLTSDRPYELQRVGAPQTIGQENMYGNHVKAFFQLQIPEGNSDLLSYNQLIAARAIACALDRPQGPVHLNFPFREPLLPDLTAEPQSSGLPLPLIHAGMRTLSPEQMNAALVAVERARRGVIVCGPIDSPDFLESLVTLSRKTGFPILADPLSQLRRNRFPQDTIVETYDTFLRNERVSSSLMADIILRFGAMPVSKSLMLWMKRQRAKHWVIDGGTGWRDPTGRATDMFYCDEKQFCDCLSASYKKAENGGSWLTRWRKINRVTRSVLNRLNQSAELTEETAFLDCLRLFPENARIFAGNSMPIRELDTFLFTGEKPLTVHANRGANGIDGVVSTAVGVSLIHPQTYLMIGDLSFFHDMNGLLAARQLKANLTIILINNDGGGIFSFLPQAAEKKYFEQIFGTPHGLEFTHSAKLYGALYRRAATRAKLEKALAQAADHDGLAIIEIPTRRAANVEKHREIAELLNEKIKLAPAGEKP